MSDQAGTPLPDRDLSTMTLPEMAREFLKFKATMEGALPVRITHTGHRIYEVTDDLRVAWMELCQEVADVLLTIEGEQ